MSKLRIWSWIVGALIVVAGFAAAQMPPGPRAGLSGTVTMSSGKPMEGVTVSARASDKSFSTTVFTGVDGRYSFPKLEEGNYSIWAQAVGFEFTKAEQALAGGKNVQQNFTLKPLQDFTKQLSGDELMASLPGNTPQDERLKTIFLTNCSGCHQPNDPLSNRFDARGWGTMVNLMSKTSSAGEINEDAEGNPITRAYNEEIVGYLTQVRGPSSAPLTYKLFPRPTGEAAQAVITEYLVPRPNTPDAFFRHNGVNWAEGEPSFGMARAPHDAVVDEHGMVWFTDQTSPERTLGRLDPKTGETTGYLLAGKNGTSVISHGMVLDSEGNIWISNGEEGTVSKFDPKTEKFTRFPRPEELPRVGGTLAVDSKDCIWAETSRPSGVIKLDPKIGKYTAYKSPVQGSMYGIAVDREDNVWFTLPGLNKIMEMNPAGKFSELDLPPLKGVLANDKDRLIGQALRSSANSGTPLMKDPRRMSADPNGDYVWVAEYTIDQLARIDIHTKEVKEYPLPHRYTQPYSTVVDKNHMVWIDLMDTDRVAKFDPSTERFTEYLLPSRGSEARQITVDNKTNPPSAWVPYYRTNKLARIQPLAAPEAKVASAGR